MPITTMILNNERGVQKESTAIVAIIAGKANKTYMTVVRIASKRPRRYAANIPNGAPMPKPIKIAPITLRPTQPTQIQKNRPSGSPGSSLIPRAERTCSSRARLLTADPRIDNIDDEIEEEVDGHHQD